jgi:hypothetical protein
MHRLNERKQIKAVPGDEEQETNMQNWNNGETEGEISVWEDGEPEYVQTRGWRTRRCADGGIENKNMCKWEDEEQECAQMGG